MTDGKKRLLNRDYWSFYMMTAVAVLGLKLYYGSAGSDALRWILAPTAWWVRILSGTEFIYESQIGYVNHSIRFIIAPSCSGIQFMAIVFAVLAGAFVHRMGTRRRGLGWMAGCVLVSVMLTVFINGIRIVLSLCLPKLILGTGMEKRWLTPEHLHTITGVAVYFTALIIIYRFADRVSGGIAEGARKPAGWMLPVSIYFLVVLGLPLLNGALKDNPGQYGRYAALVSTVCVLVLFLLRGAVWLFAYYFCVYKRVKRQHKS